MPRPPKPIDPAISPWHLLGIFLRDWREAAGLSQRRLAHIIHVDHTMISAWEHAVRRPDAGIIRAIDRATNAAGRLISLHAFVLLLDRLQRRIVEGKPPTGEGDDMDRRALLHLAATGMGMGALGLADEPIRRLLDLAIAGDPRSPEDWEVTVTDHLHAIRTRPAAQIHHDMQVDLLALHHQLNATSGTEAVELHRIIAVLAAFYASVLVRLGEAGSALRWYRTARAAADATDDLELRVRIRAHEAGHSLYGLRTPATVLRLTENALALADAASQPSIGRASLLAAQANALALLGRREAAIKTLNAYLDAAGKNLPVVPGFWEPSDHRFHFTLSQVYSALGDEAKARQAQEVILSGAPAGYHVPVNTRLHAALCTVVNGGVLEGVDQAATALGSLPAAYHNMMITETARRVLRAVPAEQRDLPAVGRFRELLAPAATSV